MRVQNRERKYGRYWSYHRLVLFVCALLVGLAGLATARPARAIGVNEAKVFAILWPDPSVTVARDDVLTYHVRVNNVGNADAGVVRVTLTYDPAHLALRGTEFETGEDWISDLGDASEGRKFVTISFHDLDQQESRSASVFMDVNDTVPDGTVIQTWATFYWTDPSRRHFERPTNSAPVIVGPGSQHSELVWMTVDPPAAPAGSEFRFASDRFYPGEEIHFWLNLPGGGQAPVNRIDQADDNGFFVFRYDTEGLAPGTYDMIASGTNSGLLACVRFTVEPPLPAP